MRMEGWRGGGMEGGSPKDSACPWNHATGQSHASLLLLGIEIKGSDSSDGSDRTLAPY